MSMANVQANANIMLVEHGTGTLKFLAFRANFVRRIQNQKLVRSRNVAGEQTDLIKSFRSLK